MRGMLILLEGLDRAGKTTQCQLLREKLAERLGSDKVKVQKVPDRSTGIGATINTYLTDPSFKLPDQAIHLLFSANRWELRQSILDAINSGITVILDRYVPSGVAYSMSKNVPGMDLDWCLNPDRGLPMPDITIFLDIDPANAHLQSTRANFGSERYEVTDFQREVRKNFLTLLSPLSGAQFGEIVTIDASRELDFVTKDVWEAIGRITISKELKTIP
ncbi:thymidylate kinase-domain-containing protein [Dipodascopsis uninucleata]